MSNAEFPVPFDFLKALLKTATSLTAVDGASLFRLFSEQANVAGPLSPELLQNIHG
jgi:hypothetical protein